MSKPIKQFFRLAMLGTALVVIAFVLVFYAPNTDVSDEGQSIFVPAGTSLIELKEMLNPFLHNTTSFSLAAFAKRFDRPRAGHFRISSDMGNQQLINLLRSGNTPVQITFNNQQTIEHLVGRVSAQLEMDSLSLLNAVKSERFLEEVDLNEEELLSLFLPNSYEMYWNISTTDFCDRMRRESDRFWNSDREQKRQKLKLTRAEVISLAAIVNEESKQVDERPRVAGVYLNRLRKGMKLQADPTVIYAMKRQANNFDLVVRRVLYKDLQINSPYNTYANVGLPPGPITMPDISSIDAVLNAESHSYLYFVVDPKNIGYHLFATTYKKHLANREVYIRWLNRNRIMR